MTPFTYLAELADKVKEKTGKCCHVTVGYWAFEHSQQKIPVEYELYLESYTKNVKFENVSELITAMKNIIKEPADEGVSV